MSNSLSEDKSTILYPTPPESLVDHTVLGKYTIFLFQLSYKLLKLNQFLCYLLNIIMPKLKNKTYPKRVRILIYKAVGVLISFYNI